MTLLFDKIEDARSLAQVVIETVREPLLVLDNSLTILVASSSFHKSFQIDPTTRRDKSCSRWTMAPGTFRPCISCSNIPWPTRTIVEGFLVEQDFPRIGERIFLLHARRVLGTKDGHALILLGFEDITERRAIEREKADLQAQTDDASEAERDAAAGNAAPHRQQPADHRQHPDAQGPRRDLRGNPPASAGRASPRHVGGRRPGASAQFRPRRHDRDRALSEETQRLAGGIHDRGKPPGRPSRSWPTMARYRRPTPSAWA